MFRSCSKLECIEERLSQNTARLSRDTMSNYSPCLFFHSYFSSPPTLKMFFALTFTESSLTTAIAVLTQSNCTRKKNRSHADFLWFSNSFFYYNSSTGRKWILVLVPFKNHLLFLSSSERKFKGLVESHTSIVLSCEQANLIKRKIVIFPGPVGGIFLPRYIRRIFAKRFQITFWYE